MYKCSAADELIPVGMRGYLVLKVWLQKWNWETLLMENGTQVI